MPHTEVLWFQAQDQSQHGPQVPALAPGRPATLPPMDSLSSRPDDLPRPGL